MSQTTVFREPAGPTERSAREVLDRTEAAPPLGLIGLGPPGRAVAAALLMAGFRLLACDASPDHRHAYAEAVGPDAPVTDDPAEIGRRCAIVLLLLELGADAAALHGALRTTLAPGGLIIDMGPALPGDLRRLAAELAPCGLRLMDAPLLPASPAIVLAGGADADRAAALPVLAALGTVVPTGAVGSAQALSALIAELDTPPDLTRVRQLAAQQAAPW